MITYWPICPVIGEHTTKTCTCKKLKEGETFGNRALTPSYVKSLYIGAMLHRHF